MKVNDFEKSKCKSSLRYAYGNKITHLSERINYDLNPAQFQAYLLLKNLTCYKPYAISY